MGAVLGSAEGGGGGGSKGSAVAAPSTMLRVAPLPRRCAPGEEPARPGALAGTIAEASANARARLAAAGIDGAALDARLLLQAATGLGAARLIADSREPLAPDVAERFDAMVERRLAREPVARILGEKEFWGLPIGVNGAALVPRPETEIVVEAAIDAVRHFQLQTAIHICDLGTGSGAILVALLSELPKARGTAIDSSAGALALARSNAERLGLAKRIRFQVSTFEACTARPYDLVVSNPPYIRSQDLAGLPPEVRDFDPRMALDGGEDGLDAYRAIAGQLLELLVPGGTAILELGAGQADAVADLLRAKGLEICDIRPDLAGIPRAVTARRPARR